LNDHSTASAVFQVVNYGRLGIHSRYRAPIATEKEVNARKTDNKSVCKSESERAKPIT
jgi:hypothetical protein